MDMIACRYQVLNLIQIYDVLRHAMIGRLGLSLMEQPYIIPMHCRLEVQGEHARLHLVSEDKGLKMRCIDHNNRVCVEFEQEECAWMDVVIVVGQVEIVERAPGAARLCVMPDEMTGRRYFHHSDETSDDSSQTP